MNNAEIIKRCFVIGPMKNINRLKSLANTIVAPILEPFGFKIITPDEGTIGTIMDQVLLNLEQADLLVADISGNNPNVMYELGIYHSFGKPSLIVKDIAITQDAEQTPFDIAAYRYQELDFDDPLEAIKILKPKIEEILKALGDLDWFPNPVTSFYDSPVAEIPTAVGLSKNYIKNFMSQILPKVFKKNEARTAYELEIMTEKSPNMWEKLDIEQRKNLKFEVWIPAKMHMANHDYIRNLKEEEMVDLVNAKVIRMSREFIMHLRYDENGHPVLVDIPTVLASLNESIQRRRGLKETQIDNKEWLILEVQELERFAVKCEQYIIKTQNSFPGTRNKMKVIWRWNI